MKNTKNQVKRGVVFFILFFTTVFFYFGNPCILVSQENARQDSIPITLDVTEELKIELFQAAVIRYFRRYTPTLQNDNTFSVQYGRFPVTVSFENDRIIITSSTPDKHSLWLSNIRDAMQNHAVRIKKTN